MTTFETLSNGITIKETERGFEVYPAAADENWEGWHETAQTLEAAYEIADTMGKDWAQAAAEEAEMKELEKSWEAQ